LDEPFYSPQYSIPTILVYTKSGIGIRASVMSSVKMILRRNNLKKSDFDTFLERVLIQAEALFKDWPNVA
jgi:hypothetical protein